MATFPQNPISGSPLIGSPVIIRVQPSGHNKAWTFHRVIVCVHAALVIPDPASDQQTSDTDYTTLKFSAPVVYTTNAAGTVTGTNELKIDISSALQAVADRYEYRPVPPSQYPYIKFRIEAWDEWMLDGDTESSKDDAALLPGKSGNYLYFYAFMGAFFDLERSLSGESRSVHRFSRKPNTSMEVVFRDCVVMETTVPAAAIDLASDYIDSMTGQFVGNHPVGVPKTVALTPTKTGVNDLNGRQVYAIARPRDGYEIRFVNGLGCLESIHVRCLRRVDVEIETEQHVVSRFETFNKFSRGLTVKQGGHEEWHMTSGPLDEQWTAWYVHEFLMATTCWLQVDQVWIPCHVMPEETQVLSDRQKATLIEVQFTLRLDIEGSSMAALLQ